MNQTALKINERIVEPRVPSNLTVRFKKSYGREFNAGTLKNISLSGAFIENDQLSSMDKNDKISVTLEVAGRRRNITAHVIWKNQLGCGVEFRHSNNRDLQLVDDLIYFIESDRNDRRDLFSDFTKNAA